MDPGYTHLSIVIFLPLVGEDGSDDVSGILDDHFASLDGFLAEQASPVDRGSAESLKKERKDLQGLEFLS